MDLTPCDAPFTDAAWVFEMLPRGYRMLAEAGAGQARLRSRHGADTSDRFAEVREALEALPLGDALLDGELCVFDRAGRLDVERLHRRGVALTPDASDGRLTYCIFDLLRHDGCDLRREPWSQRRQRLEALPLASASPLCLQRSLPTHGEWLHRQASVLGRPGIAARRRDAPYRAGPSSDWRWIAAAAAPPGRHS